MNVGAGRKKTSRRCWESWNFRKKGRLKSLSFSVSSCLGSETEDKMTGSRPGLVSGRAAWASRAGLPRSRFVLSCPPPLCDVLLASPPVSQGRCLNFTVWTRVSAGLSVLTEVDQLTGAFTMGTAQGLSSAEVHQQVRAQDRQDHCCPRTRMSWHVPLL